MDHPALKLGKAPAVYDPRSLRLSSVLMASPTPPPLTYDFDDAHPKEIPTPMFANDRAGDCVIAGRAHQTLRFEHLEQGETPAITDQDVLDEYYRESGGLDTGLVVIRSLKDWRNRGWPVGSQTLKIKAFATVDVHDPYQIRQAIFSDVGVGMGVQLPIVAQRQFDYGEPWDVVVPSGPETARGGWGGHYIYVPAYNEQGPICVTWGKRQQMTWAWLSQYGDEAYAIFDDKNENRPKPSIIDWAKVLDFIRSLSEEE